MHITYEPQPAPGAVDFLTEAINQEAHSLGIEEPTESFGFFIRDAAGTIVAGCNGALIYGSIYTDQLWVARAFRGQGLGKQLMEKVHELGRLKQCAHATVCTMSFQNAKAFYKKLGYSVDFARPRYRNNSQCFFLSKTLLEEDHTKEVPSVKSSKSTSGNR